MGIGGEERRAGIADAQFAGAQHDVAAAHVGLQAQTQLRRSLDRAVQRLDVGFNIGHVPLGRRDVDLGHDAAPTLAVEGLQAAGLHHLDLADQPLESPFGHVGRAVAGDVALHIVQLAQELLVDGVEFALAQRPAFLPLIDIGRVVAPILLDAAAAHLPDVVDDLVQEIAVMADNEQRAVPGLERALQPFDGLHVQVVGRLIEDEQIGALQQQPGQQRACLLAAAQVAERRLPLLAAEAQPLQHLADAHLVVIAAGTFKGLQRRAVLRHQRVVGSVAVGKVRSVAAMRCSRSRIVAS